jgi:hypothetical protein
MKKNKNDKTIITSNGYKCIGPCYPSNTLFYNPTNLFSATNSEPSCPIFPVIKINNGHEEMLYYDKCDIKDVNENYKNFNVFMCENLIDILNNDLSFLSNIYQIHSLNDSQQFLSDSIDNFPIYTQRRILIAIFNSYYNFIDFPKKTFVKKIMLVLKKIYNIDLSIDTISDELDLIQIDDEQQNLYNHFVIKYNK